LSINEALETTKIHSVAGLVGANNDWIPLQFVTSIVKRLINRQLKD